MPHDKTDSVCPSHERVVVICLEHCVEKPGLVTEPSLPSCDQSYSMSAKPFSSQVHRLDEATGGLLLVAKTRLGLQGLSSCFEQRQV